LIFPQADSVFSQQKVLTLENTMDIIRKFHPVARQANLEVDLAKASLQASRGVFDPSFYLRNEKKSFDGKNYYFYSNPELKIPTWFGIDIKAGFENNTGDRLDPVTSAGKSTYAGISIPVLKGLLFDKRRAAVQQSKLLVQMSRQDQLQLIADLLYDAADAYWKWTAAHQAYAILTETSNNNAKRFEFVKRAYAAGDRAAIDTTEALAQLQGIQAMQSQAWLELQRQRLELSNFLWKDEAAPYELSDDVVPDSSWNLVLIKDYPLPVLADAMVQALQSHPKLMSLGKKQEVLEVEKRAKFQGLLPTLDLNYNFLNKGYGVNKFFAQPLFENNYKYGVQFGLPLFQREARGEYGKAKIKLADLDYKTRQTKLEIENKVKSSFNDILALQTQSLLFQDNLRNQELLLKAEESKFSIGESSMFLVNAREIKLLETRQKLAELKTKFFKSLLGVQWAAGQLR
jgi:outer membrane protein TolC